MTALSNPNYVIAPLGNSPGTLTVKPTTVLPFDPGFLPGLTLINNPAQTEYDVGGYEQVLPHFTVACNEPPPLPDPNRFSDPDQALRAISQSLENYFRRCQNMTQAAIADALDEYAAKLKLAPRLPPALRNVPEIVAEGARRVRAARSRSEAIAVLHQTVAAIHKEIALVLSEDPQTRGRELRDGDVVAGALYSNLRRSGKLRRTLANRSVMRVDSMDGACPSAVQGMGGGLQRRFSPSSSPSRPCRRGRRAGLRSSSATAPTKPFLRSPIRRTTLKTSPRR